MTSCSIAHIFFFQNRKFSTPQYRGSPDWRHGKESCKPPSLQPKWATKADVSSIKLSYCLDVQKIPGSNIFFSFIDSYTSLQQYQMYQSYVVACTSMGLAHFNITHVTPCNFQAIHMKPRYNEVTILDVTCNTNSSRLAFGFSVGVNGEMKNYVQYSFLISGETKASFAWIHFVAVPVLFKTILQACHYIVIDGDPWCHQVRLLHPARLDTWTRI